MFYNKSFQGESEYCVNAHTFDGYLKGELRTSSETIKDVYGFAIEIVIFNNRKIIVNPKKDDSAGFKIYNNFYFFDSLEEAKEKEILLKNFLSEKKDYNFEIDPIGDNLYKEGNFNSSSYTMLLGNWLSQRAINLPESYRLENLRQE